MNRKQLFILLILVVVLGGVGLFLRRGEDRSSQAPNSSLGKKLLGELPINDVAQITIKEGTNTLELAKKDGVWAVRERNYYPASYSEISDFLIKAKDIKIAQTETAGPSQFPRY